MLTPPDYEKTRDFWETKGFGACGPCTIAVAIGQPVQDVINAWGKKKKYEGTANFSEMEREI